MTDPALEQEVLNAYQRYVNSLDFEEPAVYNELEMRIIVDNILPKQVSDILRIYRGVLCKVLNDQGWLLVVDENNRIFNVSPRYKDYKKIVKADGQTRH